jgi:hypothetical protein
VTSTCIPNIGPHERRRRMISGVVMLLIAIVLMGALLKLGAGRAWRLSAFVPLLLTGVSFLQVQQKTCIALAARDERNLDRGVEHISDPLELQTVKAQARLVSFGALALAAIATALFVFLP